MPQAIVDSIPVIDIDAHISEPDDLWTSRMSRRWGDRIPHVVKAGNVVDSDPDTSSVAGGVAIPREADDDIWMIDGEPSLPTAFLGWAGHDEYWPRHPHTLAEASPATYQAKARLELMDQVGVHAQAIFPNLGGSFVRVARKDPGFALDCTRAYNDFLSDWCATNPERLLAQTVLPYWDVEACVAEIERCAAQGHKAVIFSHQTEGMGLPHLPDPHWDPIYSAAQAIGLPICFHVGAARGNASWPGYKPATALVKLTVMSFLDNAHGICDVVFGGLCERFPELDFVSVESGAGYLPFLLASMDWQWINLGLAKENPEMTLLPSEYFKRQVYGSFWFEDAPALDAIELLPDNLLYETDFPHPTSISPGVFPFSESARDNLERKFAGSRVSKDSLRKVLHDNAARVYHLA